MTFGRTFRDNDTLSSGRQVKMIKRYHSEREVEDGLLEYTTDERCGLEQPGSRKMTPEERNNLYMMERQGNHLVTKYLKPAGWKWVPWPGNLIYDYKLRAPGVTNNTELQNINMFPSFHAVAEQYEQDGGTMDQILARARQPNADASGGSNASVASGGDYEAPVAVGTQNTDRSGDINSNGYAAQVDPSDAAADPDVDATVFEPLVAVAVSSEDEDDETTVEAEPVEEDNGTYHAHNADDDDDDDDFVVTVEPGTDMRMLAAGPSSDDVPATSDDAPPPQARWTLLQRLRRIEEECGYDFSHEEKPLRRIHRLEVRLDIVSKGTTMSCRERLLALEELIGLPPVPVA